MKRFFVLLLKFSVRCCGEVVKKEILQMNQAGRTLTELEDAIIQVLLRNARQKGRHAYIRGFEIGKEIGTYRRYAPSAGDRFGRAHRKLLDQLQDEGRAEPRWSESGKVRTGWRLTNAEWDRLTRDE